jgi:hypothetical protein
MHDRSLKDSLNGRGLSWLSSNGLGAFDGNNLDVLIEERFEILPKLCDIGSSMLQQLTYLLIEGEGIQKMLQTKKCVTP